MTRLRRAKTRVPSSATQPANDPLAEALVGLSDLAIVSRRFGGTITAWNPGAERLYGYTEQEMIGASILQLTPVERTHEDAEQRLRLAAGKTVELLETQRVRKDGSRIDVALTLVPVSGARGQPMQVSEIARPLSALRERAVADALAVSIVEHSDDAIISKLPDGTILSWNRGAERMFGFRAADIVGTPVTRLFPAERADEEQRLLSQVLAGVNVSNFETRRLRADGSEIDVSVTLSPVRDRAGRIVAVSKIVRDISASRQAEAVLAALRADLHEVLERSPAMIGLWNADQTCRFANTAYAAAHGLSPEQMVGRHVAAVLGEEAYGRSVPLIDAALAGTPQSFERVLRQADGSLRHELVNYVPDARSGSQPGLVVFVSDITRRVRAEEATREAGQRFRMLYERTPAMVHSIDPHGCLLSVSDRWLRRLGYALDEVLGRPITAFLRAESGPGTSAAQLLHFLRDGGPVEDMECQAVCKDGTLIDVLLSATAERDADGQFQRGLAVMVDVTVRNRAMAALRESETFLDRAGRVAGVGAWSLDLASGRVTWSDQTCRIHEVAPGYQPRVDDALRFYRDGARERIAQAVQACIEHQVPYDIELELVTATGREIWVRAAGEADATDGRVTRIFGSFQDITARRRAEIALSGQHELLRVTLDSIGDAVITTDAAGVVEWLNPVAARLTGWLLSEARGRPIEQVFNIIHEETRQPASSPVARALRDERTVGLAEHTVLVSRDDVERGIEDSAAPIRAPDGRLLGVVLVFHDVSEQRRLAREVSWRATRDALTGLLNRSEFDLRLRRAHAAAREDHQVHALMYIDLDQFKLVNDACGHAAGDQLLREVSALLQSVVRSRDTLARLGGDEFAVIMEHCTVVQARRVAQQLCDRMEQYRFLHDNRRFRIGASIGLVPLDARWTGTGEVMQAADAACYAAKDAGRNRVHEWYDTDRAMHERHGEMQWATRLEQALDENRFRLYGQRIAPVSGPGEHGLHLEVLLRLQERDGSIVAPGVFLPAAERFNLATRIDCWVLREVLAWIAAQDLDGIGLVAVNLSGRSLGDRSFQRFAAELLRALPFDPRKLCLEITETAAITHLGEAATFMAAMRALGVRIALDDFGAGASSFGYLKNLPVDFLKIDGQFIRDLLDDELDRTAVRCFREVAAVCGVRTIAECVESVAVLEELARIGIDFAQGFLLHRPEPLDVLAAAALTPGAAG